MKVYYLAGYLHLQSDAFNHVALDSGEIEDLHNFIHEIEEGEEYVRAQKKMREMNEINTQVAVEAWKKRDPYLLDIEGFERFLEYWRSMANEHGVVPNDEDYIPPCVQCVKDGVSCTRGYVYRTGGEPKPGSGYTRSKLVCDHIVYREVCARRTSEKEN